MILNCPKALCLQMGKENHRKRSDYCITNFMSQSSIEWTEMTWNPTTGCNKISAGCKYCYAEVMTRRLQAMGIDKYKDGFAVRTRGKSPKWFLSIQ
jgi:protein gp37